MTKLGLDVAVAAVLLIVLAPLLLAIAIAVKLDSPGPVFYRARRVGHRGRPLVMLKFRKMQESATGGPLTVDRDPRLTRVGAFLTKHRLDELPQFWHVVRGQMSLIGPRPEDPDFVATYAAAYEEILSVRPGITGLSQIAYKDERQIVRDESPVEDYVVRIMPQKVIMDRLYATKSSFRLDSSIVYWTIVTLVFGQPVAVNRRTGRMNIRRRPNPETQASRVEVVRAVEPGGREFAREVAGPADLVAQSRQATGA